MSYQEDNYNQLQASRQCEGRGPLEITKKHEPATPCCKAQDRVVSVKFLCTILGKEIKNIDFCWACTKRKA